MSPEQYLHRPISPGDKIVYSWLRDAHGLTQGEAYTVERIYTSHSRREHRVIELAEIPGHVFPLARFEHLGYQRRP